MESLTTIGRDRKKSRSQVRRFCRDHFLSYQRLREWRDIYEQLLTTLLEEKGFRMNRTPASYENIHYAILSGFLLTNGNTLASGDVTNQQSGGAVWSEGGVVVTNCVFSGNSAEVYGGATYGSTLYNCILTENERQEDCLLSSRAWSIIYVFEELCSTLF